MMLYPAMNELLAQVPSRYQLMNVVAARARKIASRAEEEGLLLEDKPVSIAIREIAEGCLNDTEEEMVPAEEGWMDGPLVEGIARRYLEDMFTPAVTAPRPDTLLLGCTHFPLLQAALQNVVGPQVRIVDSAATTAESVEEELTRLDLLRTDEHTGVRRFMTTDNRERFARTGGHFLGSPLKSADVELVDL